MRKNPTNPLKTFQSQDGSSNALGSTAVDIASYDPTQYGAQAPGFQLISLSVINPNGVIGYLKFYDKAASQVNPGNDVPIWTVPIQASGGFLYVRGDGREECVRAFRRCIAARFVTGLTYTDTSAASTAPTIDIEYL